jgi:hypothetical protein
MIITNRDSYKETDLAYTAGIIDSIAIFYLNKHNQKITSYPDYDLVISLTSKTNEILYKINSIFNIGRIKANLKANKEIQSWTYLIKEWEAFGLIELILPYLEKHQRTAQVIKELMNWRLSVKDRYTFEVFKTNEEYRTILSLLSKNEDKRNSRFLQFLENREKLKSNSENLLNLKIQETLKENNDL